MKYIYAILCLLLASCKMQHEEPFGIIDVSNVERSNLMVTNMSDTIIIDKVNDEVNTSDIIDSVSFIPLETTPESLFAYCTRLSFYKDKIYLMDDVVAESVFIFDRDGKFLKRIGNKGGAPDEFAALRGMAIDRNNDWLILYDNRKRKMVYFTLEGEYIKNKNVNFRFCGHYAVLPSGMVVSATTKNSYNVHLAELDEYRLLYTDSLGQIVKSAFSWDDNNQLPISYEAVIDTEKDILYYPPFTNILYSVTDTTVSARYVVEYADYPVMTQDEYLKLSNLDEVDKYEKEVESITSSAIAETETHLYFASKGKARFYTIYDKGSKKSISFRQLLYDNDFLFGLAPMYSGDDHLIAIASSEQLIEMRDYLNNNNIKISDHLLNTYNSLDKENNPVLVLLKLKNF